jgi:TolB-like protein
MMSGDDVSFGPFRLDIGQQVLLRDGKPVPLGSRALAILCALAAAKGELVTKDALMAAVWPGQIVEENAIQVHVSALRKAFDKDRSGQDYIVTVPGRGYRLTGITRPPAPMQGETDTARSAGLLEGRSIAVLPFQNMSSDPEQEYFADGMVEDIIAGLSRISWLSVISRNSSFTYKGRAIDVKQVGRDLGVRYVLEGSVRKMGDRVRVTVQLIDAETSVHLWVERYDRLLDDIFALQDEIAMSVVGTIEPNLRKAELERIRRKRPDNLDAYDLVLQAMPYAYSHMPDKAAIAIPLLEKALALEPGYAAAHAPLALCYHARYGRAGLREEDRAAAVHHAHAAIAGGGDDAIALGIAGFVIAIDERDTATGLELFERALKLSNSNALSLSCSALALAWMGKTDVAIERAQRALRLSPFDPLNYLAYNALAISYFHLKEYEKSREAAQRSIKLNPKFGMSYAFLAAALVRLGCDEAAKIAARQAVTCDPNFSIHKFSVAAGFEPTVFAPFADAWQEAGIPIE